MVTPMQHAGPLACYKRKAPCHRPVGQGGGAEDKEVSGEGTAGELREGLPGLWCSFVEYDDVQVSGEGDDRRR